MRLRGEDHPGATAIQRVRAPAVIAGKLLVLAIMLALSWAYCARVAKHDGRLGTDKWQAETPASKSQHLVLHPRGLPSDGDARPQGSL
jgi:hypothetical protein